MHLAILNLVEVLGFDRNIIEALVTLITGDKAHQDEELTKSLKEIYKRKTSSEGREAPDQNMQLGEFANFVHQELCSLSRSEKVVTQLSYGLGIPKSFIA